MERKTLEETDEALDVRIYHLERIANILNMLKMYGIRLEYLEIEMTKEEQLAYFSYINGDNKNRTKTGRFVREYTQPIGKESYRKVWRRELGTLQ